MSDLMWHHGHNDYAGFVQHLPKPIPDHGRDAPFRHFPEYVST